MLEHLSNEVQIRGRQRVPREIGAEKTNPRILNCLFVMFDQVVDDIDTGVLNIGRLNNSPPDREVTTSTVDNASHPVILDEGGYSSRILFSNGTVRTRTRVERLSVVAPYLGAIDLPK